MKKNLQFTALAFAIGLVSLNAQTGRKPMNTVQLPNGTTNSATTKETHPVYFNRCGTIAPNLEWESQFQKQIQEFLAARASENGKLEALNYTIPVIIHVVHGGQAVGTYPNLAQAQLNSQITVLNQDYGGTGFNVGNYPATAFQSYASATVALSASLTAANKDGSNRVKIANTGIQFCLALKDTLGNVLPEPGIDRINYTTKGWTNPATLSASGFQPYIDGTIKPQSIWNTTKYLNMWVTDENLASVGLLGYATFPLLSGLTGITGNGTSTTDGFWAYAKCIGSANIYPAGTYDPTYKYGRTCSHEIGHWLGLRHIWGDGGQCGATDYCVDTPPQQGTTGPPAGCYYGVPVYPSQPNTCTRPDGTASANVKNLNGDMFMNFMDYSDDVAMYMFTVDQTTRIQTCMTNAPYRKFLGTHGLCSLSAASPTANFNMAASGCTGTSYSVTNLSSGSPTPTYSWSSVPSAGVVFNPSSTAVSPLISFGSVGSYIVKVVATNSVGTSSYTQAVNITTCAAVCKDTITNCQTTATLNLAIAGTDTTTPGCSPKAGYIFGSNCYQDQEKAEYFTQSMYASIPTPKITGAIVLFFKFGTQGTGGTASKAVNLKLYNGTMASGPTGTTSPIATATANLGGIVATTPTNSVTYCGSPSIVFTNTIIIPYMYNFPTNPAAPAANGFFASLVVPTTSGDTAVVMSDNTLVTGTNWENWSDNSWHNLSTAWSGFDASMAILPIISCSTTAVGEVSVLASNINLMPNPTNGQFNIVTTLPNTTNLSLTITNAIGQQITKAELNNVTNGVFTVDLSAYNNGVYFITLVSPEGEKVVKRIILSK